MLYRFDNFELDTDSFELRQDGSPRHVEPLVFDLIRFLTENPDRIVSRDEIIAQVWDGRFVSDATVSSCIKSARKALGDSGEQQTFIRTVRGRGFQFIGKIEQASDALDQDESFIPAPVSASRAQTRPQPSLAIIPFQVLGDDRELPAIAGGLAGNLTTILTRVPLLALVSSAPGSQTGSNAIGTGSSPQPSYLLEGSLQIFGDALRASVQLIETRNGFHLWAQQFDRPRDAGTQANLLSDILPRLETQLVRAIFNDLGGESGDMSGRQLLLRAMGILALKGWHQDSFTEVASLLRRSIELEPGFALTHAYLALSLALGQRVGLLRESEDIAREAVIQAERALDLDSMDSNVLGLAGCAFADVNQTGRAIPILKNALDLNANNAQAWTALGSTYLIEGRLEQAIEHLNHGISISPMDSRLSVWCALLALAQLKTGEFDLAVQTAENGCKSNDKTYLPRVVLAAAHFLRREPAEARSALSECYRVKPDLSQSEIDSLIGSKLGKALLRLRSRS